MDGDSNLFLLNALPAEVKMYVWRKVGGMFDLQWRQALISLDFAGATAIELTMETPSSCSWSFGLSEIELYGEPDADHVTCAHGFSPRPPPPP